MINYEINQPQSRQMPDISVDTKPELQLGLSRVGMKGMELPIQIQLDGQNFLLPAKVDAFVSLDQVEARGIHMSRLYLEAKDHLAKNPLSAKGLKSLLLQFLETHKGLSKEAALQVHFELPVLRKALKSSEEGWRHYPVSLKLVKTEAALTMELFFQVTYSSTCPCSAALARQLSQEAFQDEFKTIEKLNVSDVVNWLGKESSTKGVAHAQRSRANVSLTLNHDEVNILSMIDLTEISLGTPVQAAVKRMDEQEFARLNAENLMFCEDACRKLRSAFENEASVTDYRIEVVHEESLHPHDAVSIVVKGVKGGFKP